MKLYGSTTSPFVRRLRLFMATHDIDYQFENVNIFGEQRAAIKKLNPTLKVPMLEDNIDGQSLLLTDSSVAFDYLSQKLGLQSLSIEKKNMLSHIDACSDSLVQLLILSRSDIDTNQDSLYFNIQRERIKTLFEFFDDQVKQGTFQEWDYTSIALLVLVEWCQFRQLYDVKSLQHLLEFVEQSQRFKGVRETTPAE